MNIFKWLGKSGKIALSAAQAVGLSAVVGVAGIAAWQYLDTPSDNTAFNLGGQYNPGEVVYVAGASGGSYGANGEVQSSFLATPSKAIEMTEKFALAQKRAEEYEDSVSDEALAPSNPQAYQMGGTEGLGMGANRANEEELKNNPMAFAKQSLSGVSDAIAQAQAQAQQAAAAGGQAQGAAPAGTLASASRDWGSSAATKGGSGGGGNSFNSSFVVQDSNKNSGKSMGNMTLEDADQVIKNFQEQSLSAQEAARLRARSSFGRDEMLASDKNLKALDGRSSREKADLAFIRKRSADAAANRNRAANESSRAWLDSTKVSGGMSIISGESVTTGQGQGSKDFNSPTTANMRGIKNWVDSVEEQDAKRDKSQKNIRLCLWIALPVALAAMPWISAMSTLAAALCSNPFTAAFGVALWIKAAILLAIALAPVMALLGVSIHHINNFGGETLSTWGTVVAGILTAALGLCMIPALGAALNVLSWSAIWSTVGGIGLGAGAAALLNGTIQPEVPSPEDSLDNPNNK